MDWLKHFHLFTKDKRGGRDCALLVDCHRSRLTLEFLLFCKKHRIHVICYPSHSTQLYQGLDVVIFGILKQAFSNEMLAFESKTGQGVCKENFLQVYAPAHIASFTERNIKAAFAKTGVYPFDRSAISTTAMKPSIEHSCTGDGLPLPQPSPVRAIAKMIRQSGSQLPGRTHRGPFAPSQQDQDDIPIDPILLAESQLASQQLAQTSAGYLVSSSPVKASSNPPMHLPNVPAPKKPRTSLLTLVPENPMEEKLIDELDEYTRREVEYQAALLGMRATLVLQNMYCERLRCQLFAKEKKENAPKGTGKLASDGLPRCLTDDAFIDEVRAYVERQLAEAEERERKKDAKASYLKELAAWNEAETKRKEDKATKTEQWRKEVEKWNEERDLRKLEKKKPRWKKPVLGKFPKATPRPKMLKAIVSSEDVEDEIIEAANASFSSDSTMDDD